MRQNQLEQTLEFISSEARYWVIDALARMFHNEGNTLSGNTEESDIEWYARDIYQCNGRSWDHATEDIKKEYRRIAEHALQRLPYIVSRIANRYQAISSALETMERLERAAKERAKYEID